MLETRTDPRAPISARAVAWWLAIIVALVLADVALVICAAFWVLPALEGVTDTGDFFSCHDVGCVRQGYVMGVVALAGAVALFAMAIPHLAPSMTELRWGAILAYAAAGLGLLGTAMSRALMHWAFLFLAVATACLLLLAIGCHVRLLRRARVGRVGPEGTPR